MRIAFVVHDYNRVLGHSRYVTELAERFARQHEVHVFANTFEGVAPGVQAHRVPALRWSALATILTFAACGELAIVRQRFDIVHVQGFALARPHVITAHISNARWRKGRRELEGGRLPFREWLFGALVVPLESRALRRAPMVIAVSEALKSDIAREYGRTGATAVIRHGVDDRQFNPGVRARFRAVVRGELGIGDDILFLYVGDLRKGFTTAVRALASVDRGRLVAVTRSQPAAYRQTTQEAGVADRVTILPPTQSIERYYGAADVFVLPTPYDAFGMVLTEAMACGLPVITTPHAGAAELVTDGEHGCVVADPRDVPGLAAAMQRLVADDDLRTRMGAMSAAMMRNHSWDMVADTTMRLYEQLLGFAR